MCIGIDVSRHQGEIDWAAVKIWKDHPIQFVYMKATEGATLQDKTYQHNLREARKQGFPVGSYHYFRTLSEPEDQFRNLKNTALKADQDLIPMVDVEEKKNWDTAIFHRKLQQFLDLVEGHYGKKPMIYTVNSFYNAHLAGKYTDYHFLIGRYSEHPPLMKDRHRWTVWQFSESGRVDGIPVNVDIDRLHEEVQLKDLLLRD